MSTGVPLPTLTASSPNDAGKTIVGGLIGGAHRSDGSSLSKAAMTAVIVVSVVLGLGAAITGLMVYRRMRLSRVNRKTVNYQDHLRQELGLPPSDKQEVPVLMNLYLPTPARAASSSSSPYPDSKASITPPASSYQYSHSVVKT